MNMNEKSMISAMFEEIKHSIKGIEKSLENSAKQPVEQFHKHKYMLTIDIKSSWTAIAIAGLCLFVFVLIYFAGWQWQTINRLADTDLKYRYIKMNNGIDSEQLIGLETLFEYERNNEIVKQLKQQIEDYEWALKEQARKIEQARRKESEAERLRKEAGELNGKPSG